MAQNGAEPITFEHAQRNSFKRRTPLEKRAQMQTPSIRRHRFTDLRHPLTRLCPFTRPAHGPHDHATHNLQRLAHAKDTEYLALPFLSTVTRPRMREFPIDTQVVSPADASAPFPP